MADDSANQPDQSNGARDLFLSYNNRDREAVLRVRQLLRERQLSAFLDRDNLNPGQPWFDELQSAIAQVRSVAVFIGETLGPWQKREMTLALDRQAREEKLGRSFPVIPVVLPNADLDKAPGFLLLNTFVDLRARLDDPAALDAIVRAVRGEAAPSPTQPQIELCPYRGLRAFREEDAPLFFGREAFAEQLLEKTRQQGLIAVVGPSGSGKSSVVQAGLMPLLRRERPPIPTWDAVVFTPGRSPFHNLAAAFVATWGAELSLTQRLRESEELGGDLANGKVRLEAALSQARAASEGTDRLLLIVDQFEELFTLTEEKDRKPFIEALLSAITLAPVTVALTLRADFYGQAIEMDRKLSDHIQQGLVNLGPMTREELRSAVENPARSAGLEFEPGLIERILENVEDQPGNLPLLEFALTELWSKRQGRLLAHRQYDEIGEVEGAIGQRAEQVFGGLKPDEQRVAQRAFTRLVRVSAGGEEGADTRQRVKLGDLEPAARGVLREFIKARLLVTSRNEATNEETIEVAHEALIRRWDRLKEVLNEDRKFLLWRQRLSLILKEWRHAERDAGALLRGVPLNKAQRWLKERGQDLNGSEREFIASSESASKQPRRWIAAAAAVVIVGALAAYGWKLWDDRPNSQINKVISRSPDLIKASSVDREELRSVTAWLRTLVLIGKPDDAVQTARQIEPEPARNMAMVHLAGTLTEAGEKERALELARNIVFVPSRFEAESEIVKALAKAGRPEEAKQVAHQMLEAARQIEDQGGRSFAMAGVVGTLAEISGREEALEVAREIKTGEARASALGRIVEVLAKAGKNEEARQVAHQLLETAWQIEEVRQRFETLNAIVQTLAKMGETEQAKQVASQMLTAALQIEDEQSRFSAISIANMAQSRATLNYDNATQNPEDMFYQQRAKEVEERIQAGRPDEAFMAARKIEDLFFRARAMVSVAAAMTKAHETNKARSVLEEAQRNAQQFHNDGGKSQALAYVAEGLARLHDYRAARRMADLCIRSSDTLSAYTAILREYHIERNPSLAKLFEEEPSETK